MSSNYTSLFQQQSYNDAWDTYVLTLSQTTQHQSKHQFQHPINFPTWDYVILTASNADQAKAYQEQIDYRLSQVKLPTQTHYSVIPDKDNQRVGSGGATLGVIKYIQECSSHLDNLRILVIHSGGDSKRVPQYSACGKLFSPVPRLLPDGRRSTLFDEFIIGMAGVASRISSGMLVCSGDVLLLFNPLQIDFYTYGSVAAAALSIKENVETGKDHGVYQRSNSGNVAKFLHKQTVETLQSFGTTDDQGNVDIDTGAVILDSQILTKLYSLINTPEKFDALVNEKARLSFYADFLYPLAEDSTLEQFYLEKPEGDFTPELRYGRELLWEALHPYAMKLIRLSPASFIHFGTSSELRKLMAEEVDQYSYLSWSKRVNCNRNCIDYAANNSYISHRSIVCAGSYIEDSYIHHGSVVGKNCIISGVTLDGQTVPDNCVLHGLKLANGRFVVRMYGVNDNPKENNLFGHSLDKPLWESPIYPIKDTIKEAVDATLEVYHRGFADPDCTSISLKDSFNQADSSAILAWQERLDDKVKVESLLEAIDKRQPLDEAIKVFNNELTPTAEKMLLHEADKLDDADLPSFSRKIRIYHALSKLPVLQGKQGAADTDGSDKLELHNTKETHAASCFGTICSAILGDAVAGLSYSTDTKIAEEEVVERLPVRVNWGGGWSDTPPYCMENGGTVLNAAITLNGQLPVEAVVRKSEKSKIVLTSADNGSYQEFTSIEVLQDSSNPYDPFALHKAALIACGIIPYHEHISVADITDALGGGIYLSTQVTGIPRGSGLGTSSILAGACVKALMKFIGQTPSENELYNRVMCMEQIMSTGGGWQDQVGGLAPGIKMVTSEPGMHQKIICTPVRINPEALAELNSRFALIYTGQRRLARNLLRDVVGRYIASQPDAVNVLYEIQRVAVLMRFELEKGNIDGFASLLNEHWKLSKRLDSGSTNTCIEQLFLTVDDLIDGKMICGAGGGGFLQVVLKRGVTKEALEKRLHDVFQDSGARVWKCSLA